MDGRWQSLGGDQVSRIRESQLKSHFLRGRTKAHGYPESLEHAIPTLVSRSRRVPEDSAMNGFRAGEREHPGGAASVDWGIFPFGAA